MVESRAPPSAREPDSTGVNSLQLYRGGDRWRIVFLCDHTEPAEAPIPGAAERSGRCPD